MAEKKTAKKPVEKKTTTKKTAPVAEPVTEAVISDEAPVMVKETIHVETPKQPPLTKDTVVMVASAVSGQLIWVSAKNGYRITWNEFGEKYPMTIQDLMDMRNGDRAFFVNNWITIEDSRADEILKLLMVDRFYSFVKSVGDVDGFILNTDVDEIEEDLRVFSYNLKETIAQRAYQLMKKGDLDSAKRIKAIQRGTGISLEE